MAEFKELVQQLFEFEGYDVEADISIKSAGGGVFTFDLLAKRKELFHNVNIGIKIIEGFVSQDIIQKFANEIDKLNLDYGAIFGESLSPKVQQIADENSILVGTREKIIRKLKERGSTTVRPKTTFPKQPILVSIPSLRIKEAFYRNLEDLDIHVNDIEIRNSEVTLTPFWILDYHLYKKWTKVKKEEEIEEKGKMAVNAIFPKEENLPIEVYDRTPLSKEQFLQFSRHKTIHIQESKVTEQNSQTFVKNNMSEKYKVEKSDILIQNQKLVLIPKTWKIIYSFRNRVYTVMINGLDGLIEKFEIPSLSEKEIKEIAIDYVRERYDEEEVHVEDLLKKSNSYEVILSSKDREYHITIGSHNGKVLDSELSMLRKKAILIAQTAIKEKYDEGDLKLEKTDKG